MKSLNVKLLALWLVIGLSCRQEGIKYSIYANDKLVFEILPEDIIFYDTTQRRGKIEIHEIRLREGFYEKDSIALVYPIEMICSINGKKYFWGEHFFRSQSSPRFYINFHFDPNCENRWAFSETGIGHPQKGDTIVLYTQNTCNSIELFHAKDYMNQSYETNYRELEYFRNYVDTARLAHEILLDPYYLKALRESGVEIR